MTRRERPVLVYDGSCGFCTRSVRLALHLPGEFDVVAWQDADLPALGVSHVAVAESVHWVALDGSIAIGHRAIAALLAGSGRPWTWLGRGMLLPGASWLSARAYRWVSAHRHRLRWPLAGTPACQLPPDRRPGAGGLRRSR